MNLRNLNKRLERILEQEEDIESKLDQLYEIQRKLSTYSAYIDDSNYKSKKAGYDYKFNGGSYSDMKNTVGLNQKEIQDFKNKVTELRAQETELKNTINTELKATKLHTTDLFIPQEAIDLIVSNIQTILTKEPLYGDSPMDLIITRTPSGAVINFDVPVLDIYATDNRTNLKDDNDYSNYNIEFVTSRIEGMNGGTLWLTYRFEQ